MNDLRYPVGPFEMPAGVTPEMRRQWISEIAAAPAAMRAALAGLSEAQLDTPYRPGGWTVRQVAHHVSDSHLNSYVRFRLALTEECPTIRPYDEERWAELPDAKSGPVELSLELLETLHRRWEALLETLTEADCARPLVHPAVGRRNIDWLLALYAWHGRHHVAHVTELRRREGW
jgi:hypothetical protein